MRTESRDALSTLRESRDAQSDRKPRCTARLGARVGAFVGMHEDGLTPAAAYDELRGAEVQKQQKKCVGPHRPKVALGEHDSSQSLDAVGCSLDATAITAGGSTALSHILLLQSEALERFADKRRRIRV